MGVSPELLHSGIIFFWGISSSASCYPGPGPSYLDRYSLRLCLTTHSCTPSLIHLTVLRPRPSSSSRPTTTLPPHHGPNPAPAPCFPLPSLSHSISLSSPIHPHPARTSHIVNADARGPVYPARWRRGCGRRSPRRRVVRCVELG